MRLVIVDEIAASFYLLKGVATKKPRHDDIPEATLLLIVQYFQSG